MSDAPPVGRAEFGAGPETYLTGGAAALGVALGMLALAGAASAAERRRLAAGGGSGYIATLERELDDLGAERDALRAQVNDADDERRRVERSNEILGARLEGVMRRAGLGLADVLQAERDEEAGFDPDALLATDAVDQAATQLGDEVDAIDPDELAP